METSFASSPLFGTLKGFVFDVVFLFLMGSFFYVVFLETFFLEIYSSMMIWPLMVTVIFGMKVQDSVCVVFWFVSDLMTLPPILVRKVPILPCMASSVLAAAVLFLVLFQIAVLVLTFLMAHAASVPECRC